MQIKAFIDRFPAGLMVIPLLLGCLLNTIDQARFPVVQWFMGEVLCAAPNGHLPLSISASGAIQTKVGTTFKPLAEVLSQPTVAVSASDRTQ